MLVGVGLEDRLGDRGPQRLDVARHPAAEHAVGLQQVLAPKPAFGTRCWMPRRLEVLLAERRSSASGTASPSARRVASSVGGRGPTPPRSPGRVALARRRAAARRGTSASRCSVTACSAPPAPPRPRGARPAAPAAPSRARSSGRSSSRPSASQSTARRGTLSRRAGPSRTGVVAPSPRSCTATTGWSAGVGTLRRRPVGPDRPPPSDERVGLDLRVQRTLSMGADRAAAQMPRAPGRTKPRRPPDGMSSQLRLGCSGTRSPRFAWCDARQSGDAAQLLRASPRLPSRTQHNADAGRLQDPSR